MSKMAIKSLKTWIATGWCLGSTLGVGVGFVLPMSAGAGLIEGFLTGDGVNAPAENAKSIGELIANGRAALSGPKPTDADISWHLSSNAVNSMADEFQLFVDDIPELTSQKMIEGRIDELKTNGHISQAEAKNLKEVASIKDLSGSNLEEKMASRNKTLTTRVNKLVSTRVAQVVNHHRAMGLLNSKSPSLFKKASPEALKWATEHSVHAPGVKEGLWKERLVPSKKMVSLERKLFRLEQAYSAYGGLSKKSSVTPAEARGPREAYQSAKRDLSLALSSGTRSGKFKGNSFFADLKKRAEVPLEVESARSRSSYSTSTGSSSSGLPGDGRDASLVAAEEKLQKRKATINAALNELPRADPRGSGVSVEIGLGGVKSKSKPFHTKAIKTIQKVLGLPTKKTAGVEAR